MRRFKSENLKKTFRLVIFASLLFSGPVFSQTDPSLESKKANSQIRPDSETYYKTKPQNRRVVILPFESETKNSSVDYLKKSIPKILTEKLRAFYFITISNTDPQFYMQTKKKWSFLRGSDQKDQRIILEIDEERYNRQNYKNIRLLSPKERALKLNADYTVEGVIEKPDSNGSILLTLQIFDAQNQKSEKIKYSIEDESTALQSLSEPALMIISRISSLAPVPFSIETDEPDAMVYIDECYFGRTPVNSMIVPGSYQLRVERKQHKPYLSQIQIRKGTKIDVTTEKIQFYSGLKVESEPQEALVYLNAEYLGKTPLSKNNLPEGTHRLRLSKEGHIDRFIGVELKNNETKEITLKMRPGDTETHFNNSEYAIWDWTYFDLSFSSLLSTLFFYAGYGYYDIKADKIQNNFRTKQTPLILGLNETALAPELLKTLTGYQLYQIQENNMEVRRMKKRAQTSAGIGVFSFLTAALFFYMDLSRENEVGAISFGGKTSPIKTDISVAPLYSLDKTGTKDSSLMFRLRLQF